MNVKNNKCNEIKLIGLFLFPLISFIIIIIPGDLVYFKIPFLLAVLFGFISLINYINIYFYLKEYKKKIFGGLKKNAMYKDSIFLSEIQKVNQLRLFLFLWNIKKSDDQKLILYKLIHIISYILFLIFFIITLLNVPI